MAWALEFTRQYLPEQSAVWAEDQHLVEYQILERDAAAAYQANNYALSISLRERLLAHGAPPEAMALHRARLGEELLRVGRLSEALPHLEQAGQPEALLLAARIVVATGDLAAAQRLDARLDGATAGRMWLELLRGRPDEARLRGLLKSSDRSVALCAQLRLLRLDAEAGRLDEAVLRRAERRADLLLGQDSDATVQQELAELYVAEITYLIRKVENPSSSLPKELVAELGGYRQRVEGRINEVIAHPLRVGPWMGAVLAQADRPWDLTAALFRNTPAPSRLSEDERAHYEEGAKNVALQMELAAAERRMQVPVVLAELPVEDRLFLLEVEAMLQRSEARPVHAALQVVPPPVAAWEGPDFANDVSSVGARRELLKNLEPGAALLVARLWEDPLEIGDA
ncbi:MAG TPA: hypothetical protein PLA94_30490, partial [Myxococcota bacterium]|nr:hypothetical protein [Myxococcota bacterium]